MSRTEFGPVLPLKELPGIEPRNLGNVAARAMMAGIALPVQYSFVFDRPHISIFTERRSQYLQQVREEQAQAALLATAQATRHRSGGIFSIHPFYGAVFNTALDTIAPQYSELARNDLEISTVLYLADDGQVFDDDSTREASEIGNIVFFVGNQADRYMDHIQYAPVNPNQEDKNTAVSNNLGGRWQAEFDKYNYTVDDAAHIIPSAMKLSPRSIFDLFTMLREDGILEDVAIIHTAYNMS